jgi:SET domain
MSSSDGLGASRLAPAATETGRQLAARDRLRRTESPPASVRARRQAIYIRDTGTPTGRGVFAGRAFAAGETVETCPVVLLGGKLASLPGEVKRLLFNWGVLASVPEAHCLALGYGSLYNHDNPASLRYEADVQALHLRFIAVRDIAADEELTVNYNAFGGLPQADHDGWFQAMGVRRFDRKA